MTAILNLLAGTSKSATAAAEPYAIERSLRFNSADSVGLAWTPSTAGNRKKWTFSCWLKRSKLGASIWILAGESGSINDEYSYLMFNSSDQIYLSMGISGSNPHLATTTAIFRDVSAWYHIVSVYDSDNATAADRWQVWVNGVKQALNITAQMSQGFASGWINNNNRHFIGRRLNYTTDYGSDYYLADVNFIDGQALTPTAFAAVDATTGAWTPSAYVGVYGTNGFRLPFSDNSAALNLGRNTAQTGDELWPYTVLNLSGNPSSASGYHCFSDKSTNNLAISANGDARSSAFSPYNTSWSIGSFTSSSAYLQMSSNVGLQLGTADFTIECWAYFTTIGTANGSENVLYDFRPTSTTGPYPSLSLSNGNLVWEVNSIAAITTSAITLNQWTHIAVVRASGVTRIYVNGSQSGGTYTDSSNYSCGSNNRIGNLSYFSSGNRQFNGNISNLRIVKNQAIFTGTFTPTILPLSASEVSHSGTNVATSLTGTVTLLTCKSNRFVDMSSSSIPISINGSISIVGFSPFLETDTTTGSGYFDGTGDYLSIGTAQAALGFGTGDFCTEFWAYRTNSNSFIVVFQLNTYNTGLYIRTESTTYNDSFYFVNNGYNWDPATNFIPNAWTHICVTRQSGTLRFFSNGKLIINATNTANMGSATADIGTSGYAGYLAGVRVVKGSVPSEYQTSTTTVGTQVFTPPTAPVTNIANTQLLTLQDRVNYNNSGFQDSSEYNHVLTRTGNVTQGSFSPFSPSGWSNYFDGSGDYLTVAHNDAFNFGTGQFTVEAWAYHTVSVFQTIVAKWANTGADNWLVLILASNIIRFYYNGGSIDGSAVTLALNTWNHVAVTRDSSNLVRIFVNGVLAGSATTSFNSSTSYQVEIGSYAGGANNFNGYLSNVRLIKGTAVYTANFTPPTQPLTAISGTSLLTCQSNRFVDNSSNNYTITKNGDTRIQSFSPFTSQTVAPKTYSGYFDGTGDYLTLPTGQTSLTLDTGDFTLECWYYLPTQVQSAPVLFCSSNTSSITNALLVQFNPSTNTWELWINGVNLAASASSKTATLNQWQHFMITRSGNTFALYINGVPATGITTSSASISVANWLVGYWYLAAHAITGYISNVRLIKGQALVTGAFTPSTAVLTNTTVGHTGAGVISPTISGTVSLLTCQSNRFVDVSTTPKTITVNGGARPSEFNPLGNNVTAEAYSPVVHGGSGYFDGSADYLTVPQSAGALDLGSGQFSLEFWWYPTSSATSQYPFIGESNGDWYVGVENNNIGLGRRAVTVDVNTTGFTLTANTWQHFVIARQSTGSNDTRIFVNGVLNGVGTTSQNYTIATTLRIGGQTGGSINGYLSSINLVKGSVPAAYQTASTTTGTQIFTPPTSPSTSVTGTQLLLNFNNAGIYDATGKNVLETVGNVSNTTAVKKSLTGAKGSLYFDGTGDWLVINPISSAQFGSSNWTVECWVNFNTIAGNQIIAGLGYESASTRSWQIYNSAGTIRIAQSPDGSTNYDQSLGTPGLVANTWYHIAVVKTSVVTCYVNGIATGTTATAYSIGTVTGLFRVGTEGSSHLNGYLQDLRITRSARYTGSFTPPTRTFAHNVLDAGHKQWVPTNFSVASGAGNDSLVDSPTLYGTSEEVAGAYATFDSALSSVTLSNGNLTLTGVGGSGYNKANSTVAVSSGKWYFEVTLVSAGLYTNIGVSQGQSTSTYPGQEATSYAYMLEQGTKFNNDSQAAHGSALVAGDVFMCAFDLDNNKIFFGKNGTWFASSDPVTGANPAFTLTAGTYRAVGRPYATNTATFNFGATTFAYTAPTGFRGLQALSYGGVVRGNYATLNSLSSQRVLLSDGNLKISNPSGWSKTIGSILVNSGKYYFESYPDNGIWHMTGVDQEYIGSSHIGGGAGYKGIALVYDPSNTRGDISYNGGNSVYTGGSSIFNSGDTIGVAIDLDNNNVKFFKNNILQYNLNNLLEPGAYYSFGVSLYSGGSINVNFGQRPFAYAPPTGFKSLNTQNLSQPAVVKSNTAFDATLWTGDGAATRNITGFNFAPDLVWIKSRTNAYSHYLSDTVRGVNKQIYTDATEAESSLTTVLSAFNSDGFTIGNNIGVNNSGANIVAWAWDAGTATVTNNSGSIASQVRANPAAGFSIVTYTTQSSGTATVGHGLSMAPSLILVKPRNVNFQWDVYHASLGKDAYVVLNSSAAQTTSATTVWNSTAPTSTVFSLGSAWASAAPGATTVAYCFAAIPGFSAFGTWTGNGSADGPFIYLGFRPKFIIAKQTNTSGQNWYMLDSLRPGRNVTNSRLYPNLVNSEDSDGNINADFLSNGFKIRDAYTGWNASGGTYIYAAFAENPFKYARAR